MALKHTLGHKRYLLESKSAFQQKMLQQLRAGKQRAKKATSLKIAWEDRRRKKIKKKDKEQRKKKVDSKLHFFKVC